MYKTRKIVGGYAAVHKEKDGIIQIFRGWRAKSRALDFVKKLNEKAVKDAE